MRKLSITHDLLKKVQCKEQFLTLNGRIVPKVEALIKLMKRCGVHRLCSIDDYWLLALRTYIVYGGKEMMEDLFVHQVFFHFRMLEDFNEKIDFKEEENRALKEGVALTITFQELSRLKGLSISEKENLSEEIFLERTASKMPTSWAYSFFTSKQVIMLTSCYKSNYEMKEEIEEDKLVPKLHFLAAAFYATEILKEL